MRNHVKHVTCWYTFFILHTMLTCACYVCSWSGKRFTNLITYNEVFCVIIIQHMHLCLGCWVYLLNLLSCIYTINSVVWWRIVRQWIATLLADRRWPHEHRPQHCRTVDGVTNDSNMLDSQSVADLGGGGAGPSSMGQHPIIRYPS